MAQYKIVIIGSGRIADVYALSVARNPGLRLAGFVDPFGGGHFGGKWSIPGYGTLAASPRRGRPPRPSLTA